MDFRDPPRRAPEASLLPMINVVFLLLIFFLISARMTPPEPFAVTPPQAAAQDEALGPFTLHIGPDGRPGYREALDDAAWAALAQALADHCGGADCTGAPPRLTLRADTAAPAAPLAGVMRKASAMGFGDLELVVREGAAP